MKRIKIDSQARSNFLLSNVILLTDFNERLEEIGRDWIKSFILRYEFYLYGLDKLPKTKDKKLHKQEIDSLPDKEGRLKKAIKKCFNEFVKKDGQSALDGLNKDLSKMVSEYGLGPEVVAPLSTLLISGYWEPPKRPFFIRPINDCVKNNSIILELGPQTTLKDIEEGWKEIDSIKKKLWPKNVIQRVTENRIKSRALGFIALVNKNKNSGELTREIWDNCEEGGDDISVKSDRRRSSRIRTAKNRLKKRLKMT